MKKISLKATYLIVLSVVFTISICAFTAFDLKSQQSQSESALLEEARAFAREMDAVWTFMDNAQYVINNTSDGTYEFKGLHCSIVGKSVGAIFSAGNDYTIRYTNFDPRNYQDTPDEFETEALTAFNEDSSVTEYYGIAEYNGEEYFRYAQALEVDSSCLECHGEPAGEIDITGYEKEGWTLDSVGGAISIVIPLDQTYEAMQSNLIQNIVFFLILTVFIGGVIYLMTSIFVFRPLDRMELAFGKMGEGRLRVRLEDRRATKEIARLIVGFNSMTSELQRMYEGLESQVADRTMDLQEANSELERQRDNLEKLSNKLAEESQYKTDLLSMVNHELRTPLTSIITLAQISRESANEADNAAWADIEKNGGILLEMINNMLDIARSDAGNMVAASEPMDLGDVVSSIKSTMVPLAQRYHVSFSAHVEPDVPLIMGDFEKTQRILENLVSNAIKFTPDGGSVQLNIGVASESGSVLVRVADTGIGISPEDQERIFDRFVQVDSTSTRKYNGSGLGLALVKGYVRLQGFEITLESTLGQGSMFVVHIPEDKTLC